MRDNFIKKHPVKRQEMCDSKALFSKIYSVAFSPSGLKEREQQTRPVFFSQLWACPL